MQEIWKDIPEYEGIYQASNLGRIRVLDRIVNCGIKNNHKVLRKGKILKIRLKIMLLISMIIYISTHYTFLS